MRSKFVSVVATDYSMDPLLSDSGQGVTFCTASMTQRQRDFVSSTTSLHSLSSLTPFPSLVELSHLKGSQVLACQARTSVHPSV